MSLNPVVENSAVAAAPTGARRMTLAMLEARIRADQFVVTNDDMQPPQQKGCRDGWTRRIL